MPQKYWASWNKKLIQAHLKSVFDWVFVSFCNFTVFSVEDQLIFFPLKLNLFSLQVYQGLEVDLGKIRRLQAFLFLNSEGSQAQVQIWAWECGSWGRRISQSPSGTEQREAKTCNQGCESWFLVMPLGWLIDSVQRVFVFAEKSVRYCRPGRLLCLLPHSHQSLRMGIKPKWLAV